MASPDPLYHQSNPHTRPQAVPWALYLLSSSMVAIAAVGSIFEFIDKNPFFGIIQPDNPLWAPILLTLAVTGFPSAGARVAVCLHQCFGRLELFLQLRGAC